MTELLEIYKEFSNSFPTWVQGSIGLFFTIYFKNKVFRDQVNSAVSRMFKTLAGNEILAHELFYHESLFQAHTKRITFSSKMKTDIFRLMISTVITSSISVPKQAFKERKKEIKNMHPAEVIAFLLSILYDIVKDYEKNIQMVFNRNFGIYGKEIYQLVYLSEHGFKTRHQRRIDEIQDDVYSLNFMSNKPKEILRIFLYQIMFSIQKAVFESITVFKNLNGNLDSIISKIKNQGNIG